MQFSLNLIGLTVLVTRPGSQGEELCAFLSQLGAVPFFFPTLSIEPPDDIQLFKDEMHHLNKYDWAIFISPEAVKQSIPFMTALPKAVAAIGGGTASLLKKHHVQVDCYPETDWNSEGFLKLPAFSQINHKKIAIIKGQGGRDTLKSELTARGAEITEINAYKRNLPRIDVKPYVDRLSNNEIDVVICTSVEGMVNLKTLLLASWSHLKIIPIVILSKRMQQKAHELGFEQIILAKEASLTAMVNALTLKSSNRKER